MMLQTWIIAARPKTLLVCLAPLLIAAAQAVSKGAFDPLVFLCALIAALSLQVGVNFTNDLGDFLKGGDTEERKGPTRVLSAGLLQTPAMIKGIFAIFSVTILASIYLIIKGGLFFAFLTALSILCATLYTIGPYSLAYLGIADIFAFAFFGPIPVAALDYLMTGHFSWVSLLIGCCPGFFSAAVLSVNNARDYREDKKNNKRSPAVRFGLNFGKRLYLFELLLATCITPIAIASLSSHYWPLSFCALFGGFVPKFYKQLCEERNLNQLLAATAKLGFFFAFALSLCLLLSNLTN